MKTLNLIKFLFLAGIFFISSCQIEDLDSGKTQSVESNLGVEYIHPPASAKSYAMGMLSFNDTEEFLETLKELEELTVSYEDNFMSMWNSLDEDELDKKMDELNYDSRQPLIDFQEQFSGFSSLLNTVIEQEKVFLNNEMLDDLNDPDDMYIYDDELRAVLNNKGQVKIGTSLYQMTRFGYIEITDGDYNTLALVENGDASTIDAPNVIIHGAYFGSKEGKNNVNNATNGGCRTWISDEHHYYPTSDRRIKGKQVLNGYSYIWGSSVKAKTVHYKKIRRKWKRRPGTITAEVRGESKNQYCALPSPNNMTVTRNRTEVKVKRTIPSSANFVIHTEYRQLKTIHKRHSTSYTDYFYE